jgi:N-acetyltransferase
MIKLEPVTLVGNGVVLEPMNANDVDGLIEAASDGELWTLWYTAVPEPKDMRAYVTAALNELEQGKALPWLVRDLSTNKVIGSTRYYEIVPEIDRVEIGYTFYDKSWQRTHVNTTCKLLLMTHAFETLGCAVIGFRTDVLNLASQKAIEALGAQKEGVLRHHRARRNGSVRDSVMYSMLRSEWPEAKQKLEQRLAAMALSFSQYPIGRNVEQ